MSKTVKLARKVVIGLLGFPLLGLGIILIPLPGPGLLVSLAALFILSWGFDWAGELRDRAVNELKNIYRQARALQDDINNKHK